MAAEEQKAEPPLNALREDLGNSAPWYRPTIGPRIRPSTRVLFEDYCDLSGPGLESHLYFIRDQAWSIRNYPCVGQWGFLEPGIYHAREYGTVLTRLKNGGSFLDIGCCMAQDLRRLAADGAPTDNMYATDIVSDFWEIGYDLFRDRDTMKARFLKADVLEAESALDSLEGKIDVVYAGSVLHLFGWKKQVQACKRIVRLSKVGTLVLGCQMGRNVGQEVASQWGGGSTTYYHDAETFKTMWQQIGEETGTNWEIETELGALEKLGLEKEDLEWMSPGSCLLQFAATRLEGCGTTSTVASDL